MVELELVGLSEDGRRLILANAEGDEFAVPLDNRLRGVIRGVRVRPGQLEIDMESALRPRDIQARIRAGEAPEAVAQVAQVPVDKIMGYAVPVLAERQHIAQRAQRSAIRRKNADGSGRLLGDTVSERLRSRNLDPDTSQWDAWRRKDGRWTVEVRYLSGERERIGTFLFDAPGRYTVAEDDDARWLVGEQSSKRGPQPRDKSARRLTAVSDESDALPFDPDTATELTAVADALSSSESAATRTGRTDPGDRDADRPARSEKTRVRPAAKAEREPAPVQAPKPERRRRGRGRASVPSWDEIMFGQRRE